MTWPKNHALHSSHNAWRDFARNRNEQRENASSLQAAVWIDAICINQKDTSERAEQVKLMGSIYEGALTVKIWLGKGDARPLNLEESKPNGKSSAAKVHLGQYGSMPIVLSFVVQALRNAKAGQNKLVSMKPLDDLKHRNVVYGFPEPTAKEWDVVRRFFSSPWFERVWVVQEVVLARQATAILGDWQIRLSALGQAAIWFQASGYALPRVLKYHLGDLKDFLSISHVAAIWQMHAVPGKKLPLLDLLRDFRDRHATQDVDKVYATFGLANETMDKRLHALIEPDYTKPVGEVYRDVARFLIVERGNLLILSHAGGTQAIKPFWPSWTPDWNHQKAAIELVTETNPYGYNADGDEPLTVGDAVDSNSLALEGIEADHIKVYGEKLKSYGFKHMTYQEEIDFVKAAWTLVQNLEDGSGPYASKQMLLTLISTLTAGFSDTVGSQPTSGMSFFEDAAQWISKHVGSKIPISNLSKRRAWLPAIRDSQDSGQFHEAFVRTCMDRRFFLSGDGRMGIGPETLREGDIVAVLFGGILPYVLRPAGGRWKLIGECYVPGLIKGEAVEHWKASGPERQLFELI